MSDRVLGIIFIVLAFAIIVGTIAGVWHRWEAVFNYLMQGTVV